MERPSRLSRPHWQQALAALGGLLLFVAAYLVAMRLTVDVSEPGKGYSPDYRDTVYFWLHAGTLATAAIAGFALGKWLNGLGVAYALLFVLVVAFAMAGFALGSFSLACHAGHNDLIRHWTC
jgi:hypothetical protein